MTTQAALFFAVVALAVLGAFLFTRQRKSRKQTGWVIGPILPNGSNTSRGYPERPEPLAGGECAFDFVPGRENHVHYLTRDRGPITGTALRVTYRITGDATFRTQEGGHKGWLSVFLQRDGDDFTAQGEMTYFRWWALPPYRRDLQAGTHTIEVPLDPPNWRHTMGNEGAGWFAQMLASEGRWGVTFGGQTGLGHGVYVDAPARFELLDYKVV